MKKKTNFIVFIILSVFFLNLAYISPVEARLSFRKFIRSIRRASHFVVTLPNRSTRWMGPILGPIAADVLTSGISRNARLAKIFSRASKIDRTLTTIEEQKAILKEIKDAYNQQAKDLAAQAIKIRDSRAILLEELKSGNVTYQQYRDHVLDLEEIAQTYESTAEKFDRAAQRMNLATIIKIAGQQAIRQTLRQAENIIIGELNNEIKKIIDPDVIKSLVEKDGSTADSMLDLLISGDLSRILKASDRTKDFDVDELKKRIREQIKQMLEENKQDVRENWKEKIQEVINKSVEEMNKEKESLPTTDQENNEDQNRNQEINDVADLSDCPPGYEFCRTCGVQCRQKNCNDVTHAHWDYEGHCVCGSSGSIEENPKDPNQECSYGPDNKSCPSCVYACVGLKDKCPEKP